MALDLEKRTQDQIMAMTDSRLFRDVGYETMKKISEKTWIQPRKYSRGSEIFPVGRRNSKFGIVVTGSVLVVKDDYWGNRNIVGRMRHGDLVGESYALTNSVFGVTAMAETDAELLLLSARPFVAEPVDPDLVPVLPNLIRILSQKNMALGDKASYTSQRTIRDKLLVYLSDCSERSGSDSFDIPFDRQGLADYLAADRSALSAELGRMRDDGMIRFRKNHFELL